MSRKINSFNPAFPSSTYNPGIPDPSQPEYCEYIMKLVLENGVVCIPNLNLEPDDLELLLHRLGKPLLLPDSLKFHKSKMNNSSPYVTRLTNIDQESNKVLKPCNAAEYWHSDGNWFEGDTRYSCTVLQSKIRPAEGGYTGFLDSVAAFNALPFEMKKLCRHVSICVDINLFPEYKGESYKKAFHDLVTFHKFSGTNCLYLGAPIAEFHWKQPKNCSFPGILKKKRRKMLDAARVYDLKDLQKQLWAHIEKEEFTYVHKYGDGDLLIWDNVLTMHRSMGDYGMHPRKMIRGQIRYE